MINSAKNWPLLVPSGVATIFLSSTVVVYYCPLRTNRDCEVPENSLCPEEMEDAEEEEEEGEEEEVGEGG